MAFDMRFAALGKALLAQPEVAVGIIPGGGGTQRLPLLVGRVRTLEVVLGCQDIDASTTQRVQAFLDASRQTREAATGDLTALINRLGS